MITQMDEPNKTCDLTVIVLTLNEEKHIRRCIESVKSVATRIVIIDSGSTDRTCDIASALGSEIYINPFTNYAVQFNWGLDHSNIKTKWVMRLDADEYISKELVSVLQGVLLNVSEDVSGFTLNLRRIYMGKWLRHGSLYPIKLLRIWRFGHGKLEERLMDEHVNIKGRTEHINADFSDHNLNSITWWTDKHNKYASREAVDLLNLQYHFMPHDSVASLRDGKQAGLKRWIKEFVYARLPGGFRAFAYFFYRYVIRLGFLDGAAGAEFHFLQGFWYRYLVDAKVAEVKRHMRLNKVDAVTAIHNTLGIKIG
jgi:glycosyltransferase involved in cell wall biosynthesis